MKKLFILLAPAFMAVSGLLAQDLPTNPETGKCYVKCTTPDEFRTETVKILKTPAYKVLKVVPAEYKTVEERVMIKPASKKFVYHPAVFETYYEDYESKQAATTLTVVPAKLGANSETIVVEEESAGWEYGAKSPDCASPNPEDCRVICYVKYPEVTKTIPTKKLDTDATTTSVAIPNKMAKIKKERITKEAYTETIEIPAEYTTITKTVLVKDAYTTEETVAATYEDVAKQVLVKKGGVTVWEEVDCKLTEFNLIPIYYELGSARLTADSKRVIDNKLYALMTEKPNISIELNSHTDSRGSASSNLDLSQRRAQAVVDYLVAKGISKNRLVAKGYGETRLVNGCSDGVSCTEAQHQQNRRTEFRIISK